MRISTLGAIAQAVTVTAFEASSGLTPELAAIALVVSSAVTAVALTVAVGRTLGARALRPSIDLKVMRPLLRVAVQLHPGTLAVFLTMRVDLLFMAALTDYE